MPKTKLLLMEASTFSASARGLLDTAYSVQTYGEEPCSDAQVLVTGLATRIDRAFLSQFPKLHTVASLTTGTTHIDLAFLKSRGIRCVSLSAVRTSINTVSSTAELTVALIFALGRSVVAAHTEVVAKGVWQRMNFWGNELRGRTIGVIGYGRIGAQVSGMAAALGLRVVAHDIEADVPRPLRVASLRELLGKSDIVTLHADFRGEVIIGSEELAACRSRPLLVNTARGELVDEQAVCSALESGVLGGYATDVLVGENVEHWDPFSDPIIALARNGHNVVVTPHLGGCTVEGFQATQLAMSRFLVSEEIASRRE